MTHKMPTLLVALVVLAVIIFAVYWLRLQKHSKSELVPFYDTATKSTINIPKDELGPGVVLVQIKGQASPVYVDSTQLRQGDYQHPPFEGEERAAILSLATDLYDVYPRTYEEWEDGFRRDQNPAREIAGWIHISRILKVMGEKFSFSQEKRRECYKVLIACFTGERTSVRQRSDPKLLSELEFGQAVTYFYEGGY